VLGAFERDFWFMCAKGDQNFMSGNESKCPKFAELTFIESHSNDQTFIVETPQESIFCAANPCGQCRRKLLGNSM